MKNLIPFLVIICCTLQTIAQYNPEIDIQGQDDNTDGAELQLSTTSQSHFLRLYGGHDNDPRPYLYFNNSDVFSIANGAADFTSFTERLTILQNGFTGINNATPGIELQVGTFDVDDGSQIEAINLDRSHYVGLFSGRQSVPNSVIYWPNGRPLSFWALDGDVPTEYMTISGNGNTGIGTTSPDHKLEVSGTGKMDSLILCELGAAEDRPLWIDTSGRVSSEKREKTIHVSVYGFTPWSGTHTQYRILSSGLNSFAAGAVDQFRAGVSLPIGTEIKSITFYYKDADAVNDFFFSIIETDLSSDDPDVILVNAPGIVNDPNYLSRTINFATPLEVISDKSYYLQASPFAGQDWSVDMFFKGATMTYYEN